MHWVAYIGEAYFESSGAATPGTLSYNIIKQKGSCVDSEQKSKVLYTKVIAIVQFLFFSYNSLDKSRKSRLQTGCFGRKLPNDTKK